MKTKTLLAILLALTCVLFEPNRSPHKSGRSWGHVCARSPDKSWCPGRVWLDYAGKPADPVRFLADNGFNAVRVTVEYGHPLATDMKAIEAENHGGYDAREKMYLTNMGGIDLQVALAKSCRNLGMKVVLTIHFGQDKDVANNWHEFIPDDWLRLDYRQTLEKIDGETRRLIRCFLTSGVQPDIVIVENEADSGMLFQYLNDRGEMATRHGEEYALNDKATGNFTVWPKCAGYFKRVILSVKDELQKHQMDVARTRIAVHTTCNPGRARSTFDRIFLNKDDADAVFYGDAGQPLGLVEAVPKELRDVKLSDLVDVIGFSYYPQIPEKEPGFAYKDSFEQLAGDLAHLRRPWRSTAALRPARSRGNTASRRWSLSMRPRTRS